MLGQISPPTLKKQIRDAIYYSPQVNVKTSAETRALKDCCGLLFHFKNMDYCQTWTNLLWLLLSSMLSLEKAAHFVDQSELCGMYTDNSRRGAAPVLFPVLLFFFIIGSSNRLDFTVSQVHLLLCYQLH